MIRPLALPFLLLVAGTSASAQGQASPTRIAWNKPSAPFRIIGNVYFVGTAGLSAYLITGPKGHVLIDGGLEESAPLIKANIRTLGLKPEDVRVLLNNHAHYDHSGGLAALKQATGARLLASAADTPDLEAGRTAGRSDIDGFAPVKVDGLLADGQHVRLPGIDLVTRLTPGHTKGCTSFTMDVTEAGTRHRVLFACSITVAGQDLTGGASYPQAARDFRATFAKLRATKADVFLNFHPSDRFWAARERAKAGDKLAFVDPAELGRQVDEAERGFEAELKRQRGR